ncbi:MAG: cold shock domain-containing protein [Pseudomonadota bacterium]
MSAVGSHSRFGGRGLAEVREEAGETITGRVKWYDAVKGYGFVVPDNGGGDVMVHASCVRNFGITTLPEGAEVTLVTTMGARGLHAQELVEVDQTTAMPLQEPLAAGSQMGPRPTDLLNPEVELSPLMPARVKWFDKQKGFGFVNVFGISDDVFVHMEIVRRCGFPDLSSGEGMAVRTFKGPRGLMVAELKLWETGAEEAEAKAELPR